jgi:hypothetical protein
LNKIKKKKILCKAVHIRKFVFQKIKFIYTKDIKKIINESEKFLQKLNIQKKIKKIYIQKRLSEQNKISNE